MRHHRPPHGETASQRCRYHDEPTLLCEPETSEDWLLPGEAVQAETTAHAWRYLPLDVPYDHRTILFGGPVGWTISAIASAIGNRRTRQAAERLAAPQWRYLGYLPMIATNERFLVWYEEVWCFVWLTAVTSHSIDNGSLCLTFEADPPYRFEPEDLGALADVLRDRSCWATCS